MTEETTTDTELTFDQRVGTTATREPNELYKKWFRFNDTGGFLSIRAWSEAGMVAVDIGRIAKDKLESNTQVWVPLFKFAAYLRALANNLGPVFYKDEELVHYGGAMVEGKPLSRIFKVMYWDKGNPDSGFRWACGHFQAEKTDSGAYKPNLKAQIRQDSIKVTRAEMLEISLRIDTAITSYAAANPSWLPNITEG